MILKISRNRVTQKSSFSVTFSNTYILKNNIYISFNQFAPNKSKLILSRKGLLGEKEIEKELSNNRKTNVKQRTRDKHSNPVQKTREEREPGIR